jgi:hypothetical protein
MLQDELPQSSADRSAAPALLLLLASARRTLLPLRDDIKTRFTRHITPDGFGTKSNNKEFEISCWVQGITEHYIMYPRVHIKKEAREDSF